MQNRPGQGPGDTRNLIIAMVLGGAILFGWDAFVAKPARQERQRETQIAEQQQSANPPPAIVSREESLESSAGQRVQVVTPALDGTILLQGARFDDLNLRQYRRAIDRDSPEVTLLSPSGAPHSQDVFFGWEERDQRFGGIGAADTWRLAEGASTLTPETPITLTIDSDGLEVRRTIAVDQNYVFTVTDVVRNVSDAPRDVRPFGAVRREGLPEAFRGQQIVHQGMVGVFGPEPRLHEERYENAQKHARDKTRGKAGEDERILELAGPGGWMGLGDHYWLTAMIPDQREQVSAYYDASPAGAESLFRAAYRGAWRTIQPNQEVTYTQHLFAGAKRVDLLRQYQRDLNAPDFDKAVDWGFLFFFTRPFFAMLDFFGKFAGNFGLGILMATVVIKVVLFPIVYQSNMAMAKLRKVQPKMKEIQERFAADKQRQQQEMIKLYQTEKINPVAGCVPILLQIPVFYALYKVLTVTIEMRHAPFFGWVRDLSAPDPLYIFNLFGLLPYDPSAIPLLGSFLAIGPLAVMYGATMWALQAMNPPPADPVQASIFKWMPIIFVFLFAGFPAGLVIYWVWSNILSILQQYIIMRAQGVDTEFDKFVAKMTGRGKEAEGAVK